MRLRPTALPAAVLTLMGVARAAEPTIDLTGTWTLDRAASDPLEPLLDAVGRPWYERKLASRVSVTYVMVQSPGLVATTVEALVFTRAEDLRTDGTPQTLEVLPGAAVETRTTWSDDGTALCTRATATLASGRPAPLEICRTVADGGATLLQEVHLDVPGAEPLRATRVFRRQPADPG